MNDTLAKIRTEIENEIKQSSMADRFDQGWLAGLGQALTIIDREIAAEQERHKPAPHVCDYRCGENGHHAWPSPAKGQFPKETP